MWPEHFYFSGAGWLGYFFYFPAALLISALTFWIGFRRISKLPVRWGATVVFSLILITLPLWEALLISFQAERLCKERGGLHVYKTVEVDGFLQGGGSIKYWAQFGYSYVESGSAGKKKRWTMQDGKATFEVIPEYISRYALKSGETGPMSKGPFRITTIQVADLHTGEVLGDLVYFSVYPSLFDNLILGLISGEFNPWICGNEAPTGKGSYSPGEGIYVYHGSDVIKATLRPTKRIGGREQ